LSNSELKDTECKRSTKTTAECNKRLLECKVIWVSKRSRWSSTVNALEKPRGTSLWKSNRTVTWRQL
jgi:hypothetical protein